MCGRFDFGACKMRAKRKTQQKRVKRSSAYLIICSKAAAARWMRWIRCRSIAVVTARDCVIDGSLSFSHPLAVRCGFFRFFFPIWASVREQRLAVVPTHSGGLKVLTPSARVLNSSMQCGLPQCVRLIWAFSCFPIYPPNGETTKP